MKKILFISFLIIGTVFLMSNTKATEDFQSDYEKGWKDGWCEGWKDVKGQNTYCPYTPYAPYPEYDCSEGYKCGYNRGFKYGRCKAKEKDCDK